MHEGIGRRTAALWGTGLVLAAIVLGVVITIRGVPYTLDSWWNDLVGTPAGGPLLFAALALDRIGGGWIAAAGLPLLVMALLVALRRRWWGALFFAVSSAASALAVQALKQAFLRERPDDILVLVDAGSFPSGHVANAATLACALWILLPRWWVALAGGMWAVAMALARTYLSAHWPSDTLGGALLGLGVVLLTAAAFDGKLRRERAARTRPPAKGGAPA